MIYADFIKKVKDATIVYDEDSCVWYLEPEWQTIVHEHNLDDLDAIPDLRLEGWYDIEDVLKLEVEKRNALMSRKNFVLEWFYNFISTTIEPSLVDSENNIFQSLLDLSKQQKK